MAEPYYDRDGITIYLGDCRDVLPTLGAVDHVLTDPPYARDVYARMAMPNTKKGSGTPDRSGLATTFGLNNGSRLGKLAAGAIGVIDEMIDPVGMEIGRLVRRWALVFSDVESCHLWRVSLELASLRYVRTGAWVKPDPMPQFTGDRPAVGFEPCTIAHAQGPMRWNGGGLPAVWVYNTAKGAARPDHPCPKPLDLMLALVRQFSDYGETILDPFMGSGTTLVAAKTYGRRCIGIELEEKWAEGAAKRLDGIEYKPPLDLWPAERGEQSSLLDIGEHFS